MFFRAKAKSDAFAFALGGAGMVGTFGPVPVVPNDRINKAWDERLASPKRSWRSPLEPDACYPVGRRVFLEDHPRQDLLMV